MDKTIKVNGEDFSVYYLDSDNKNAVARIKDKSIIVKLPKRWSYKAKLDAAMNLERRIIKKLIKRHTKLRAIPNNVNPQQVSEMIENNMLRITSRVKEINDLYFKSELGEIRIRKKITNWGSCSRKNNININLALLFLAPDLLDYVIVHELSHTKERNHSEKFWKIVENIIPDYKDRKKELRKYILTN